MLNGDAHHSFEVEQAYASDPLLNFQTERAHDTRPRSALHAAMASHRILYAGDVIFLPERLGDALHGLDCFVVRSPVEIARMFIRSEIEYSLLLFDETEAGAELESYARALSHRERTPVIIVKESEGLGVLVDTIKRRLTIRVP